MPNVLGIHGVSAFPATVSESCDEVRVSSHTAYPCGPRHFLTPATALRRSSVAMAWAVFSRFLS